MIASAHLKKVDDVPDRVFNRYAVLNGLGKIGAIYGVREDVD